jgi:hypothetical protein
MLASFDALSSGFHEAARPGRNGLHKTTIWMTSTEIVAIAAFLHERDETARIVALDDDDREEEDVMSDGQGNDRSLLSLAGDMQKKTEYGR